MKTTIICIFALQLYITVGAADNYPIGSRSSGLADASVTFSDLWSAYNNQAGLADIREVTTGASCQNRFFLAGLSVRSFAVAVPLKSTGVFGLSATMFGNSLYSEKKAGFCFSKRLGEKVSAGIQLNYWSSFIAAGEDGYIYGSKSLFTAEAGILAEPVQNFKIGFHLFNPTSVKISEYNDEHLPVIIRFGGSYTYSEKVTVCTEVEKSEYKAMVKAGIEYKLVEPVDVRVGVASNPSLWSLGFGFRLKRVTIDISTSCDQVLGYTPGISLVYTFKKGG